MILVSFSNIDQLKNNNPSEFLEQHSFSSHFMKNSSTTTTSDIIDIVTSIPHTHTSDKKLNLPIESNDKETGLNFFSSLKNPVVRCSLWEIGKRVFRGDLGNHQQQNQHNNHQQYQQEVIHFDVNSSESIIQTE